MAVKVFTFNGINGLGVVPVPGLKVGDLVIAIMIAETGFKEARFAEFVVTNGELFQTGAVDFSTTSLKALVQRDAVF